MVSRDRGIHFDKDSIEVFKKNLIYTEIQENLIGLIPEQKEEYQTISHLLHK